MAHSISFSFENPWQYSLVLKALRNAQELGAFLDTKEPVIARGGDKFRIELRSQSADTRYEKENDIVIYHGHRPIKADNALEFPGKGMATRWTEAFYRSELFASQMMTTFFFAGTMDIILATATADSLIIGHPENVFSALAGYL